MKPTIMLVGEGNSLKKRVNQVLQDYGYTVTQHIETMAEAMQQIAQMPPLLLLVDSRIKAERSGEEIAKQLKSLEIPIVFLDNDVEPSTADSGIPINFLVQSFCDQTLQRVLASAIQQLDKKLKTEQSSRIREHIFIKQKQQLHKVSLRDIYYIESDGNYSIITTTAKKFAVRISLSRLKQQLPGSEFEQISKGCVVQKITPGPHVQKTTARSPAANLNIVFALILMPLVYRYTQFSIFYFF